MSSRDLPNRPLHRGGFLRASAQAVLGTATAMSLTECIAQAPATAASANSPGSPPASPGNGTALPLGTIDLAYLGASFVGATYKPISIVNAPYIWRDYAHHQAFSTSPILTELTDGYFKQTGHKIVAITYYGARHPTANRALNKP